MKGAEDHIAVVGIGCNFPGGKPVAFENFLFVCLFLLSLARADVGWVLILRDAFSF